MRILVIFGSPSRARQESVAKMTKIVRVSHPLDPRSIEEELSYYFSGRKEVIVVRWEALLISCSSCLSL